MTDYPDEYIENYKQNFNSADSTKQAGLRVVNSSSDSMKTFLLVLLGLVVIILGFYVYLVYSDKLTPVNNVTTLLNNNVTMLQNITPVVNLYVNVQVNQTAYNVSEIIAELNNSGFLDQNVSV